MSDEHFRATAARLTAAGRGAVAVIRVCGAWLDRFDRASELFRPANGNRLDEQPLKRVLYGRWGWSSPEDVVVCRTAADVYEVQCHGGEAAVARILADLSELGIPTIATDEQFRRQADVLEVELQSALSQALTWRTADHLNEQCRGLLRSAYERLATTLWDQSARAAALEQLDQLLAWSEFGRHLTEPWSVVLTGRPNVGKSSLINALLGYERAIVSDLPGTTRDVVTSVTAFDGWPVHLSDTAGVRDTDEPLEAAGIARARERAAVADVRILLLDIGEPPTPDDLLFLANWPDALVVAHKCDRPDAWQSTLPAHALHVSSIEAVGLAELQARLVHTLAPRVPAIGTAVPVTPRQIAILGVAREALVNSNEPAYRAAIQELLNG